MSDKKPMKERFSFSFKPDTVKTINGEHKVVHENPFVLMGTATQGELAYTPRTNQYWIAEGVECPAETFQTKFLPYLRWAYDQIETIDGKTINSFPATPENIAAKRRELSDEALDNNEPVDYEKIVQLTNPVTLKNNKKFEDALKKDPYDERLIRRLTSMTRL